MITIEALEKIAVQSQTGLFPNIVREYFQHIFLSELYKLPGAQKLLFKGGTALRIIYGSPRFSEDLDFSAIKINDHSVKQFVEDLFVAALVNIELMGLRVEVGRKTGATSGGYFGVATFKIPDYQPVDVAINVSVRNRMTIKGEVDSVANDFVPTYTIIHLSQEDLVAEKVFGALLERQKPRDFYDLYFMMRKNMLSAEHKKRLKKVSQSILAAAKAIDFRGDLGAFLPASQQAIVRDFHRALTDELNRQVG